MELFVDYHSGTPIYQQLFEQIRSQVRDGTLAADEPLPSIRSLAKDMRVSVITTKRAYEELEKDGLIYTVPGKGCFVAGQNDAAIRESQCRELESQLRKTVALAKAQGLEARELRALLDHIWEDES